MIINHYPYPTEEEEEDEEDNWITNYLEAKKIEGILFCGNLCASDEPKDLKQHMELFLGFAETPAHNMWVDNDRDKGRCRLGRFEKKPAPYPLE